MNLLAVALLAISTETQAPKMLRPSEVLQNLMVSDPHAALRFCAERPALHARRGEAAASDMDRQCDWAIQENFHDALHPPTLEELGPILIRALQKSPKLYYLEESYTRRYRIVLAQGHE